MTKRKLGKLVMGGILSVAVLAGLVSAGTAEMDVQAAIVWPVGDAPLFQ